AARGARLHCGEPCNASLYYETDYHTLDTTPDRALQSLSRLLLLRGLGGTFAGLNESWAQNVTRPSRFGERLTLTGEHLFGHPFAEAEAVVLAAILWVDVGHVGQEDTRQRRLVRRELRQVVGGDDGLREGGAEDPVLFDPRRIQVGADALECREVRVEDLGVRGGKQRVVHG